MARLPVKSEAQHEAALAQLNCVHLGGNGCEVYAERPLICRLFGTTLHLACPHGKRPDEMISEIVEQQVHGYLQSTRQVLV
jgi:Fe-S-cluster containining protein